MSVYSKILVPYDNSKSSDEALECAISIAKKSGGKIILLQIIEQISLPPMIGTPSVRSTKTGEIISMSQLLKELHQELKNESLTTLQKLVEKYEHIEIPIESITQIGYPAEKILEYINHQKINLVVMGMSALSGISKIATIGSVARRVAEFSSCAVVLVH